MALGLTHYISLHPLVPTQMGNEFVHISTLGQETHETAD